MVCEYALTGIASIRLLNGVFSRLLFDPPMSRCFEKQKPGIVKTSVAVVDRPGAVYLCRCHNHARLPFCGGSGGTAVAGG